MTARRATPISVARVVTSLLVVGLLLAVLVLAGGPVAGVVPMPAGAGGEAGGEAERTVGRCLDDGQVWLHVQAASGQVLRSECVGRPASGREALAAAEVPVAVNREGYICALAGEPERCPARFAGRYWQYSHASSPGGPWRFSQLGADAYRPQPGTVEGWCYNTTEEDRCELPVLAAAHPAAPRVDLDTDRPGTNLWLVAGMVAFLVATGVFVTAQRRRRTRAAHATFDDRM